MTAIDKIKERTVKSVLAIASILAVTGCSTLTPVDDPMYLRMTDIEARLIRIERLFDNESLITLATQLDQLRADTQSLRGEVETLRFETQNSAERQRNLYVDVDERLRSMEQAQTRLSVPPPAVGGADNAGFGQSGAVTPSFGSDQEAYDAAFALIQARRYEDAANAFNSFLITRAGSPLSDNAQYWLAETHYVRRQFDTALPEFQKVVNDYPQSAKLPDALLKVGYCNFELQRWDAARAALQQVARLYPDTTAARLAQQRLDRIAQEAG
jgi:tol-pal system protein YbgF